jgi:PAS domain S-box-containing protein
MNLYEKICEIGKRSNLKCSGTGSHTRNQPYMALSYDRKIVILFTSIIIAIVAGSITTYVNNQTVEKTDKLVQHTREVLYESENVLSLTQDIVLATRGYIITGDSAYLAPFSSAMKLIGASVDTLQILVKNETPQSHAADSLEELINKRISISVETIQLRNAKGFAAAQQAISTDKGKQYMDKIRDLTVRIQAAENKLLMKSKESNAKSRTTFIRSFYILMASTLVLLIVVFFTIRYNLKVRLQAEKKLKALIESTPDALVIVDSVGSIVIVNKQTEKIFGYHRSEIIGKKVEVLIPERFKTKHPHYREGYSYNPQARAMGTGIELFARKKDGTEFPVEISLSPLKSEGFVISAIRDITKNKEQEEAMRKYSILEAKSKEMEQFTYIASHDLRQPLLTILNYIKLFDEDYADKLDEEGKSFLQSISRAATRMDNLILGLLDYSRLSRIKQLEVVNCNETLQAVLADLGSMIISTNAKVTANELPTLNAYPLELNQLFQNLIANALKFKKKGTLPEVNISAKKVEGGFCFEFRDNGIGIEAKDMEKIFVIFQRLHTIEEYEGTGLGLAYCKKIVELHHGQIWVESKPNQGSSFYFTINT